MKTATGEKLQYRYAVELSKTYYSENNEQYNNRIIMP